MFASWMQENGESSVERSLAELERARYRMKGA
jgi:hypothetical protein